MSPKFWAELSNNYTVKFDIPDQSVPLVNFSKNPLYQEIRYIENKFIIDYNNNPFLDLNSLYRGFTYGPVYRRSLYLLHSLSLNFMNSSLLRVKNASCLNQIL